MYYAVALFVKGNVIEICAKSFLPMVPPSPHSPQLVTPWGSLKSKPMTGSLGTPLKAYESVRGLGPGMSERA